MATLAEKPVVGAGGGVYITAVDPTKIPTTVDEILATFDYLGLISEDGLSYTPPEEETEEMNVWQLQFAWDIVTTSMSSSFGFALAQWSRDTLTFALGGGSWTENVGHAIFDPPEIGEPSLEYMVAIVITTSSGHKLAVVFPRSKVTEREEVTFNKGEMSTLGVTVTMLGQEGVQPYRILGDLAGLPAPAGGGA